MRASSPLIAAKHLAFRYPDQQEAALDDVGMHVMAGQAVGLLGPNGSGKSTLINLLMGLLVPQGGEIAIADEAISIGWVPQEYAFYPELTCRENLALFADMLDLAPGETATRIDAALDTGSLHEFADRRARQCSGGVRRRLNLAIALLQRPAVLLLDEPTTGVDPQSRAFLLDRIRQLVDEGAGVLYATHYMEEVAALCSHIVLLDRGRVVASGDLHSLLGGATDAGPFDNLEQLFMHYTARTLRDG